VAPIYWILGLTIIAVMLWFAIRSNRRHSHAARAREVAREIDHLRHVIVELALERHDMR
jgi:uncharacterized membrane protein